MELVVSADGKTVSEGPRAVPVASTADVIVCGGGVAGLAAAIAAARNGASTLLVERNSFLGGTATAALMAGRCLSVSHNGDAWTRGMSTCMHTGQAAGTAAALAASLGVLPRKLVIDRLQQALAAQGIGFAEPLEVPAAVRSQTAQSRSEEVR